MNLRAHIRRIGGATIAGFAAAALLLLAGIAFTIYEAREYQAQKLKEVVAQARMLAASTAPSVDFDDRKAAQEYLDTLRTNPEIDQAAVYDLSGDIVARYTRPGAAPIPLHPPAQGSAFQGDFVTVTDAVERNDRRIGSVYIHSITEPLSRRIFRYIALLLLFTMASLTVAVLVIARNKLAQSNARLIAEMEQRERAEDALRQSQKMEAVGQLTGGIAHDFNNMLAIIMGSLSMLHRRLLQGRTDVLPYTESAIEGARRAAKLTQQLLAFSRRQPLSPVKINPNKLVSGMTELLSRTMGEHIRFETVIGAGIWPIFADHSQLETAILNLVVNARDAMPDGGKLTIETANAFLDETYVRENESIPAGQYVMIAVTDTGSGMTKETIAKAFEPFFTTKQVGKGTGLGLSQVYGFVKQSRGHVKIYSEPGHGTTVKLYLPRDMEHAGEELSSHDHGPIPGGQPQEIVLVVEDEENVRRLSVDTLRELGYTVCHADGVRSALRMLETRPEVNLVFTDVIMPDGTGRTLADEVRKRWPGVKILFTTGYTRNAIVHNGVLDQDVQLIMKPFTVDQLATKVREVLG